MTTYRVYLIKERTTENVVYVGMTSQTLHKRFKQHVGRRKINPKDYFTELVHEDLTISEAVTLEELLINQYCTRTTGWNKAPMTKNGYSKPHTAELKAKWSAERKGKPFNGTWQARTSPNSPEHNRKISEAVSKPIICLNDGRTYPSLRAAAKKLGLCDSKISLVANGKRAHTKGYKFKYL